VVPDFSVAGTDRHFQHPFLLLRLALGNLVWTHVTLLYKLHQRLVQRYWTRTESIDKIDRVAIMKFVLGLLGCTRPTFVDGHPMCEAPKEGWI